MKNLSTMYKSALFNKYKLKELFTINVSAFGGFAIYYLPNSKFLDFFKAQFHMYKNAEPHPMNENLTKLHNEVMEDMKIPTELRDKMEIYFTPGFRAINLGSVWTSKYLEGFYRAIIGLPYSYSYNKETMSFFSTSGIELYGKPVDWSSETGKELKKSLMLSEIAKKFALAQQISEVNTPEPIIISLASGILPALSLLMYNSFLVYFSVQRSAGLRFSIISILGATLCTLWVLIKDTMRVHYEAKSDAEIADLGKDYILGGIEYYEQLLLMNQCLRTLLDDEVYTFYGNEKSWIRVKNLPLTSRRDFMKKRLEDI